MSTVIKQSVASINHVCNQSYQPPSHGVKEIMLINKQTGQVFHPIQGKEYSDGFLKQFHEVLKPQTYRNHPFFKLEERVRMKS